MSQVKVSVQSVDNDINAKTGKLCSASVSESEFISAKRFIAC